MNRASFNPLQKEAGDARCVSPQKVETASPHEAAQAAQTPLKETVSAQWGSAQEPSCTTPLLSPRLKASPLFFEHQLLGARFVDDGRPAPVLFYGETPRLKAITKVQSEARRRAHEHHAKATEHTDAPEPATTAPDQKEDFLARFSGLCDLWGTEVLELTGDAALSFLSSIFDLAAHPELSAQAGLKERGSTRLISTKFLDKKICQTACFLCQLSEESYLLFFCSDEAKRAKAYLKLKLKVYMRGKAQEFAKKDSALQIPATHELAADASSSVEGAPGELQPQQVPLTQLSLSEHSKSFCCLYLAGAPSEAILSDYLGDEELETEAETRTEAKETRVGAKKTRAEAKAQTPTGVRAETQTQLPKPFEISQLFLDKLEALVARPGSEEAYLIVLRAGRARLLWRSLLSFPQLEPLGRLDLQNICINFPL